MYYIQINESRKCKAPQHFLTIVSSLHPEVFVNVPKWFVVQPQRVASPQVSIIYILYRSTKLVNC